MNLELWKAVLLLESCKLQACKYTAPPRAVAVLFSKIQLSTNPLSPAQITAPPSPWSCSASSIIPNARFPVKFEYVILPL